MFVPRPVTVDSPEEALRKTRVIWGALLAGQTAFTGITGFLIARGNMGLEPSETSWIMTYISFGFLVIVLPLGYFIRGFIFRRHGDGQPTPPGDYVRGTIVFLAMCEFVALFGLVTTLVHRSFFPPAMTTLLAMTVQVLHFPDGRPMRPPAAAGGPIEPR